jgi:hypothetical protein
MIADNLTTWAEFEENARSDCHGWSASPVHEIVTQVFGISPALPGFKKIRIAPRMELLESASGRFFTPAGDVSVSWTKEDGLEVKATADVKVEVVFDGVSLVQQLEKGKAVAFSRRESLC